MKYTHDYLKARQGLPLEQKIVLSIDRIRKWYEYYHGDVYVSFSGGKDSTVLLDLVRSVYPKVLAVFVNTGLEYPEIIEFVKTIDNVEWLKPKMPFGKVIEKYGFPVVSKDQSCAISRYRETKSEKQKYYRLHGFPNGKKGMISAKWQFLIDAPFKISEKCCDVMKKEPMKKYAKITGRKPMIGIMADESNMRTNNYLKNGCNAFHLSDPKSTPLGFWVESDIWEYLKTKNISYSKIYDMGETRTGCMFCMFGVHLEGLENRFHRMKKTHPKQYDYCINKLGCGAVLDYIGVDYSTDFLF